MMQQTPCHNNEGMSYPRDGVFHQWDIQKDIFCVNGLVKNKLKWSLEDFQIYVESFSANYLYCCNPEHQPLRDIEWIGIFGRRLVEIVKPLPSARSITACGMDGREAIFSIKDFSNGDNIIAIASGSGYLTSEQGGPIRLMMANLGGWNSVKALKRLRFNHN